MTQIRSFVFYFSLLLLFSFELEAETNIKPEPQQQSDVRMLINLLDYIAKDYPLAVKDSTVINDFEYTEMLEFSVNTQELYERLAAENILEKDSILMHALGNLSAQIKRKASPHLVKLQAHEIRNAIMALNLVPLFPEKWPNLVQGAALYAKNCASCHGENGNGNGIAAKGLNPEPSNFLDPELFNEISPLQAFNTITLGIEGTSMRAFDELTPEEAWSLSFYILNLAHAKNEKAKEIPDLEKIATLSNTDLKNLFPEMNISAVRTFQPEETTASRDNFIQTARDLLRSSQTEFNSGNFDNATSLALKAYLQGVEPIEARVKASDNALFQDLETSMMGVRSAIKSRENVDQKFTEAYQALDQAETLLGNTERSLLLTALIAMSILLREGLEAFFVILAIVGILKSMGANAALKWVHAGWMSATAIGIAGWFFADMLTRWDAQSREFMEGAVALFAVIVLLYLGFWMHGKTNASKWKKFVEEHVQGLMSKNNMFGLAGFSFLVVFREAFESVIFLSSLTIDGRSESSIGVFTGSIAAAILLFAIAWSMMRWFKKLPISKVFLVSSIVVLILAFVMAGDGIHALQEGGYIDITSFPINLRLSFIGLYPTYETIIAQVLTLAAIIGLWKWSGKSAKNA